MMADTTQVDKLHELFKRIGKAAYAAKPRHPCPSVRNRQTGPFGALLEVESLIRYWRTTREIADTLVPGWESLPRDKLVEVLARLGNP
jgi:hypothetical protein